MVRETGTCAIEHRNAKWMPSSTFLLLDTAKLEYPIIALCHYFNVFCLSLAQGTGAAT